MFVQFAICVIIILLCWITKDEKRNKNLVLPFSFLIITIFFAIRYDYGLDYWSYYFYYESGRTIEEAGGVSRGTGEVWFYYFMNQFPRFSYFIIAHTIIVFSALFFVARKHLSPKYYPLFFFLILTMSVLAFSWISSLRSTMAAAILWIGLELFYIEHKQWIFYFGIVVVASLFHTSALLFIILPFIDFIIVKTKSVYIFILLIAGMISTLFFTERLYNILLSSNVYFRDAYEGHLDSVEGYSIFGVIHNSLLLFPYYFIVTKKQMFKNSNNKIYVLASLVIVLRCFLLDFHGRMSSYLFIYVIFALAHVLPRLKKTERIICMAPFLIWCFFGIYLFYMTMILNEHTIYSEGNYIHYHTIFEPSMIP